MSEFIIEVFLPTNRHKLRRNDRSGTDFAAHPTLYGVGSHGRSDPNLLASFGVPLAVIHCITVDVPAQDLTRHRYCQLSPRVIENIQERIVWHQAEEFGLRWFDEQCGTHRLDPQTPADVSV